MTLGQRFLLTPTSFISLSALILITPLERSKIQFISGK